MVATRESGAMPEEILDGVWDITCRTLDSGKRYRAYLFDVDVPTLVDCGLAGTVDALADGLDEVGLAPARLVITHGDGDHIGGFDGVVERYDPATYVPEQLEPDTAHPPDHAYGDGDRIGPFEAVHLPGHEPENHALVDEAAGVAVLGDALSGADQRGLPTGYFHLPPARYSQDLNRAEESLERLLAYEFEAGLVYHGSSVLEGASDAIDAYVNIPT